MLMAYHKGKFTYGTLVVSQLLATSVPYVNFLLWYATSVPYMYLTKCDTCEKYLMVIQQLATSVPYVNCPVWYAGGIYTMVIQMSATSVSCMCYI